MNENEKLTILKEAFLAYAKRVGEEIPEELIDKKLLEPTNWNDLVDKKGMVQIQGKDYITLGELRRLARIRGYQASYPKVVQTPEYTNNRQATVEWHIVWNDGVEDGACADASYKTVNTGFKNFTVAIAGNRAEARAIRAALGIEMCSDIEAGPEEEENDAPISENQKNAINFILNRKKLGTDQAIQVFGELAPKMIVNDKIILDGLTQSDATKVIGKLNAVK